MSRVLDVVQLSAWYDKDEPVVSDIHFSLDRGAIYGLLGVNGAGKTTLLNTLTGVNRRFSGSFCLDGIEIGPDASAEQWHASKKKRYFAADHPLLFPEVTPRQYAEFAGTLYDQPFAELEFLRLAERFRFMEYVDRRASELSLGNRQKAVLITGLMLRTPLFILDEPLVGLDVESIETFYDEIHAYCSSGGTVLFSSHLLDVVKRWCDCAIILHDKRIQSVVLIEEELNLHQYFFGVLGHA